MNTNEPAFPRDHRHDGHNGMDLRDYFAAKAMSVYLNERQGSDDDAPGSPVFEEHEVASLAYDMADAMLRARVEP